MILNDIYFKMHNSRMHKLECNYKTFFFRHLCQENAVKIADKAIK